MSKTRLRHFVSDTLLIGGLTLYLVSMFQPFIVLNDIYLSRRTRAFPILVDFDQAKFYTFKIDYYISAHNVRSESFTAYWFGHARLNSNGIGFDPNISVMMFAFQILTLVLAVTALRLGTRMRVALLISASTTTLLMTWFNYFSMHQGSLSARGALLGFRFAWDLSGGYWLTYPAIICFTLSAILSRRRRTATDSACASSAND